MMWVKLTLAPVVRASWLFKMSRLTSSSRAGTVRTLVAVGTPRLASMLATILDAAPRSTTACSSRVSVIGAGAGVGVGVGAGVVVAGGGVAIGRAGAVASGGTGWTAAGGCACGAGTGAGR